jgi:hypothetical protein
VSVVLHSLRIARGCPAKLRKEELLELFEVLFLDVPINVEPRYCPGILVLRANVPYRGGQVW